MWVSRTLTPFFGFFSNFSLTFVFLTWIAFNFTYMLSVMGPAAAYVGGWHAGWLTAPGKAELMAIATVLTALFTALMVFGVRAVARASPAARAALGRTYPDVDLVAHKSHRLDLGARLETETPALAATELLLTKLQIAEINAKDLSDAAMLLWDHEPAASDGPGRLNVTRLAATCAADWGLYTTVTENLGGCAGPAAAT